jgi:hypothetical protein
MVTRELISQIIDSFSRNLVGKFCKRIEILGDEGNMSILKKLAKETVYEECRTLKRVLFFYVFGDGKNECIFFGKEKENEEKDRPERTD